MADRDIELSSKDVSVVQGKEFEYEEEEGKREFQRIQQSEADDTFVGEHDEDFEEGQGIQQAQNKPKQGAFKKLWIKFKIMKKKFHQNKRQIPFERRQLLLCSFLLLMAFLFFAVFISSECPKDVYPNDDDCIDLVIVRGLPIWMTCILLSTLCLYTIFYLVVMKGYNKIYAVLAGLMAIYLQFIHYRTFFNFGSISLRNYKQGHSATFTIFMTLEILVTLIVMGCVYAYRKNKKAFIMFSIFAFVVFLITNWNLRKTCNEWSKGLQSEINFEGPYCQIPKPGICWPDVIDGWLNMTRVENCEIDMSTEEKKKEAIKKVLHNYNITDQSVKYLAWQLPKNMSHQIRTSEILIMEEYIKSVQQYNTKEEAFADDREVVIDIQNLELLTQIKRNETLVEERKKIQNENGLAKNVIVVYIDTVSRAQGFRKLKKSMEFLKKYAEYIEPRYKEENRDKKTFEFFRYHSIDKKTYNNAFALQYNTTRIEFKKNFEKQSKTNQTRSIFHELQDSGYIVAHSTNTQSMKSIFRNFNYSDEPVYQYFEDRASDHEFFLFDPNYVIAKNPFGLKRGASSIFRRCVYHHDTNYFPFQYGMQFLKEYRDEKKFLYLEFTDGHEITSEVVQYVDDNLYNFFLDLEKEGFFSKDTMLYLLSDHGQHLLAAFTHQKTFTQDVYGSERMLPMYYMMVTNDILNKFSKDNNQGQYGAVTEANKNLELQKVLKENEQPIFGMWQVRNTFLTSVYGMDSVYASDSLFTPIKKSNSCWDINMAIELADPKEFCVCTPKDK